MNWKQLGRLVSSREVATFFAFFLLSFVIWLLFTIGTQREITMVAPVVYYGVPDDVKMDVELPTEVEFTIEDEGSQVWRYIFASIDTIEIDMTEMFQNGRRKHIKIDFEGYVKDIAYNISQTCDIVSVDPSDFQSDYQKVFTKRVPVVLKSMPQTGNEFAFAGPVTISPSTVRIRGTRSKMESIRCIYADTIREVITEDKSVALKLIREQGVEILDKSVTAKFNVERLTEKVFSLPVTVKNEPEGINIKVFPKSVNVVFKVGLSKYQSLNVLGLTVVFDYNTIVAGESTNPLRLDSKDSLTNIDYKIVPDEAEFIIEKQ